MAAQGLKQGAPGRPQCAGTGTGTGRQILYSSRWVTFATLPDLERGLLDPASQVLSLPTDSCLMSKSPVCAVGLVPV